MTRSPIEMMVDRACGFDPDAEPAKRIVVDLDSDTKALMNVGDAAVAWLKARQSGSEDLQLEADILLAKAAAELVATGW